MDIENAHIPTPLTFYEYLRYRSGIEMVNPAYYQLEHYYNGCPTLPILSGRGILGKYWASNCQFLYISQLSYTFYKFVAGRPYANFTRPSHCTCRFADFLIDASIYSNISRRTCEAGVLLIFATKMNR